MSRLGLVSVAGLKPSRIPSSRKPSLHHDIHGNMTYTVSDGAFITTFDVILRRNNTGIMLSPLMVFTQIHSIVNNQFYETILGCCPKCIHSDLKRVGKPIAIKAFLSCSTSYVANILREWVIDFLADRRGSTLATSYRGHRC